MFFSPTRQQRRRARHAVVLAICASVNPLSLAAPAVLAAQRTSHRAIIASFDGFSESWFRTYADSLSAPHLWRMFEQGMCADAARPAFPSVTPSGHAAIWTGAYGNVNGIAAAANGALPWATTTILDAVDGYKAPSLRAEPVWLAAARQGKRVFSHLATQSPQPPGFPPVDGSTPELDSARARDARASTRLGVGAVNVYNELIAEALVIRAPETWGFGRDGDSLRAAIRDDSTVVVSLTKDPARVVLVRRAPVDTTNPATRPLARYFSAPLRVDLPGGRRTFVYFRLFELRADRREMLLFASEARVIEGNTPAVAAAYDSAVQGVPGNGAGRLMERAAFGPRVPHGGDGTAEYRYLETVELVVRQFMRGTEWGWGRFDPELATDYTPYPDEALHTFMAYADPRTPNVSGAGRANAARMLRRVYGLVDLRLAQFERFASRDPNTRLFVTGEHGMRPVWLAFKANVALRDAGLLATDSAGNIDLSRTRAAATRGSWISVNRTTRKGGIVPPDSAAAVIAQVERVLRGVRDSAGTPIVERIYRSGTVEGDSLGIGGPAGGDVYFDLAPGYYWGPAATGTLVQPMAFPQGEHGYPSIDRDMQPALCVLGGPSKGRIGTARLIDIAPSAAAWIGIEPPAEATGRSLIPIKTSRK